MRVHHVALVGALLAYAWLVFRTAWLSDDAFISLRTVSNLLQGHGLRWNIDERVQTFTHPLWLFALTGAHAVTQEPFYSSLYLSWVVSSGALACLLFGLQGELLHKLLAWLILCSSQAFVDFSSSGLENPLTHLLVVAFVATFVSSRSWQARGQAPRLTALAVIAGLAALNRLDTVVLLVPAWLVRARHTPTRVWLTSACLGLAPLLAWEIFSTFYYGFPFPNTAYAKLSQSSAGTTLRWLDGVRYLGISLRTDPITLGTLAGTCVLALWKRDRQRLPLLAGALLYLAYVVHIGGDFMNGRFLSAPLLLSVCCLASSDWLPTPRAVGAAFAICAAAVLLGRTPPAFTGADFGVQSTQEGLSDHGIHDERRIFFAMNSLRNARRLNPARADHPWTAGGLSARLKAMHDPSARVQVSDAIGHAGYYAGPNVHLVDRWALADALIARLPSVGGRYGHFPRVIPEGYLDALRTGDPARIVDPSLERYYEQLVKIVRGPLLSRARLRAIWDINRGAFDDELRTYAFQEVPHFVAHLKVRNPTGDPCISTYVWNDFRTSEYSLDTASTQGESYDVTWDISAGGARTLNPPGPPIVSLDGLSKQGVFTIAVSLARAPGAGHRRIYELRYAYSIDDDGELVLQKHPWPAWLDDSPTHVWRDVPIDDVLASVP
ncbi:MAG: hypothetical protein ABW321_31265 [Polyangiales bacterium]